MQENGFLSGSQNSNITALFNTDGVCLYKSSHIEIWPIFLTINELPPHLRFARENVILGGIWQGKGKPPFHEYMKAFSDVLVHMYNEGVTFTDDSGEKNTVKLAVICSPVDLLSKAGLLNMTQFNGEYACITCVPKFISRGCSLVPGWH